MFSRARITTLVLIAAGVVMLGGSPAQAQTATQNLTVTATAVTHCSIAAATLAFGNYDPTDTAPLDAETPLTVRCTRGTNATVGLGNGLRNNRTMLNAVNSETLAYQLFSDTTRTTAWLDGAPNWVSYIAANNAPFDLHVYGRIAAGADVVPGSFSDTVVATIHF